MSRSGTGAPSSFLGVPHQGRRDGNSRRSGRRDGGGGGSKKLLGQSAIGRCPTNARGRPGDIPELTVILGWRWRPACARDLGRRRLTLFPNVARGLTFQRCVAAAFPRPPSVT